MFNFEIFVIVFVFVMLVVIVLQVVLLLCGCGDVGLMMWLDVFKDDGEWLQCMLCEEQWVGCEELQQGFDWFWVYVVEQLGGVLIQQGECIDGFGVWLVQFIECIDIGLQKLVECLVGDVYCNCEEFILVLICFGEQQQVCLVVFIVDNEKCMGDVCVMLEVQFKVLQQDNVVQLEKMCVIVDEKLQSMLEMCLGQLFKLVFEWFEVVQCGLGEMQNFVIGVGDFKCVFINVKKWGIFGEVQLGVLLEDMFIVEQYVVNVIIVLGSNECVEFVICMLGQDEGDYVYLLIDVKFLVEDYQCLFDVQEIVDVDVVNVVGCVLEICVCEEVKCICSKYVVLLYIIDFVVFYLFIEGLYVEVIC